MLQRELQRDCAGVARVVNANASSSHERQRFGSVSMISSCGPPPSATCALVHHHWPWSSSWAAPPRRWSTEFENRYESVFGIASRRRW